MNTITEANLVDFVKNKAVKQLNIAQTKDNRYEIVITLTWKDGNWKVVTTRGKPREWACLNRLARHCKEKYGALPLITLTLEN
jgi:hypothetical protein